MKTFSFKVIRRKGQARAGVIISRHGKIRTPVFMPVGTQAAVKALTPQDLRACGVQIILSNTYHLFLRPGDKLIAGLGGLHRFSNWQLPILTDSGGYQVTSLADRRVIDEQGVTFYSHLDGSKQRLTAEKSIEIQRNLGADIIMAFDEATPDRGKRYAREAMLRTHRWLDRSIKALGFSSKQALFGIIQGGSYRDLRRLSARFVVSKDLPGVAIGGGSIGQDVEETERDMSYIRDLLPEDRPRYLMGVGVGPAHVLGAILSGGDMFDCVAPTRLARTGLLYSGKLTTMKGNKWCWQSEFKKDRLNISNRRFKTDDGVIDINCDCYTCKQGFSRAYLHHLFKARELNYYRLASLHNVRVMIKLTEDLRREI